MPRVVLLADTFRPNERDDFVDRLGIPLATGTSDYGVAIARATGGGLELRGPGGQAVSIELAPRRGRGDSPLVRALGIERGVRTVFDATAGLGRDAAELLAAGCVVTLCEREAWLAAVLAFEIERAGLARARCICGDGVTELAKLTPRPDAVYLDPMFPPSGKRALPKLAAQLLRAVCEYDPAADAELLAAARRAATRRVVVKRHPSGPPIDGPPPSGSVRTKAVRFDIYGPDHDPD